MRSQPLGLVKQTNVLLLPVNSMKTAHPYTDFHIDMHSLPCFTELNWVFDGCRIGV